MIKMTKDGWVFAARSSQVGAIMGFDGYPLSTQNLGGLMEMRASILNGQETEGSC